MQPKRWRALWLAAAAILLHTQQASAHGAIMRFDGNAIDSTFHGGKALVTGDMWVHSASVAVLNEINLAVKQLRGGLVIGGSFLSTTNGVTSRLPLISRLNADGSPLSAFGLGGVTTFSLPGRTGPINDEVMSVAVDPFGVVYALVTMEPPAGSPPLTRHAYLAMINSDGSLSTNFGSGGFLFLGELGFRPVLKLSGDTLWIVGSALNGTNRLVRIWQVGKALNLINGCDTVFHMLAGVNNNSVYDMQVDSASRLVVVGQGANNTSGLIRIFTNPLRGFDGFCNLDTAFINNTRDPNNSADISISNWRSTAVGIDPSQNVFVAIAPPADSQDPPTVIFRRFPNSGSERDGTIGVGTFKDRQDTGVSGRAELNWRMAVTSSSQLYAASNFRGATLHGFSLARFTNGQRYIEADTSFNQVNGAVHVFVPNKNLDLGGMAVDTTGTRPRIVLVGTAVPAP